MAKSKYRRGKHPKTHRLKANGKVESKLNIAQKEDLATKIIEWIAQGISKGEIRRLVMDNAPVAFIDSDVDKIIRYAVERLAEITKQDLPTVIATHMEIYEKVHTYFEDIGHAQGANKAMKAKENLLHLHKEKVQVNQKNKVIIERQVEYDLSKLSPPEQKRMNELINKAK